MFRKFLFDEKGVTAIEYAVMAAAMGLALIAVMPSFSSNIVSQYSALGSHIAAGK